jgi:hypothetical protein
MGLQAQVSLHGGRERARAERTDESAGLDKTSSLGTRRSRAFELKLGIQRTGSATGDSIVRELSHVI